MSMTEPWIDLTTHASRRRTLRTLVKAVVALVSLSIATDLLSTVPEPIRELSQQQWRALPAWRVGAIVLLGLGVCASALFGLWKLWNYQSEGTVYLCVYAFLPPPAWLHNVTMASSHNAGYFASLCDVAIGMLLLLCWTQPDVFSAIPQETSP